MLQEFNTHLNIQQLPKTLELIRVLEHYEGDLLTQYKTENGGIYIEKWCDCNGTLNRYLIVKSDMRSVAEYLGQKITMHTLLFRGSDGFGFILDRNFNYEDVAVYPVRLSELADEYLPQQTAFHNSNLRPDWDTIPMNYLTAGDWNTRLFADLEKTLTTAAGFAYYTSMESERKLPSSILAYDYSSGYSYGKMYERIRDAVPEEQRARPVCLAAASPGILTIDSPSSTVKQIIRSIRCIELSYDNFRAVTAWSKTSMVSHEEIPNQALTDLRSLCRTMQINPRSVFPDPNEFMPDPTSNTKVILTAAKLVVAYIKNLKKLIRPIPGVELVKLDADFNVFINDTPIVDEANEDNDE